MKKTNLSFLVLGLILFNLTAAPVLAKSNDSQSVTGHQTSVNMKIKSLKVNYVKQYGHTYASLTGHAVDPDGEAPYQLMFYFMSEKDNHLDGLISGGETDNQGNFWLQYRVPTKGKIIVCAHDDQAGDYRCESVKVKAGR